MTIFSQNHWFRCLRRVSFLGRQERHERIGQRGIAGSRPPGVPLWNPPARRFQCGTMYANLLKHFAFFRRCAAGGGAGGGRAVLGTVVIVTALRRSVSFCCSVTSDCYFAGARSQRLSQVGSLGTFLAEQESTAPGRGRHLKLMKNHNFCKISSSRERSFSVRPE